MARKLGKRQENMLAKIAAALGKDLEEVKEVAAPMYTQEAKMLQKQAVYNFFKARVKPEKIKVFVNGKERLETDFEFEARQREWRFKICETCGGMFAYAYSYDGVKFCSLECVDAALKKIGLGVTPNRDPKKRWGMNHPAIVPASVFAELQDVYSDSAGTSDDPFPIVRPTPQQEVVDSRQEVVDLHASNYPLQDNPYNMPSPPL
jgi:hypothetical protein